MRRGLTVIELMIVLAVLSIVVAVSMPGLNAVLGLEQQSAIKEIGQTLMWLQEESSLRNVAFQMEINLDRNQWSVKQGDAGTLIFASPKEAEEFRVAQKDKMKKFTKRQLAEGSVDLEEDPVKFDEIDDPVFTTKKELPEGLQFVYVYTPQYGEKGVTPHNEIPDDPIDESIAYIHIFPDGTAEHTIIQIAYMDEDTDGMSLEMEPMGGMVKFSTERIDPEESLRWIPTEGPDFR